MAHQNAFKEEKEIQDIAKKVGLNWAAVEKNDGLRCRQKRT